MKLYLAEIGILFKAIHKQGMTFENANILQSFVYCDGFTEKTIIPTCKSFLLDSGAFTFIRNHKGERVDWDSYVDRYAEFINRNGVELFFELDIDAIVGIKKVEQLRGRLESATGKKSIPVFHKPRGKQYFIDMCDEYDYVAIGGIAKGLDTNPGDEKYFPWFVREAHRRGAKIHGLGFTPQKGLGKYGFDSVDSSSWTAGMRFGSMCYFDGAGIKSIPKPEGKRVGDYRKAAVHCFKEWIKYSDYLERY